MKKKYDVILVGAGLFNAVIAHRLKELNKTVLVIEKRNHIAGNCYTEDKHNIDVGLAFGFCLFLKRGQHSIKEARKCAFGIV